MENFVFWYQNLQKEINPIAFKIGYFPVGWYSLMYLVAFAVFYLLVLFRIKKGEIPKNFNKEALQDLILYSLFGVIIGGRLGYVIFYNFIYYFQNPLEIISPFDSNGNFIGIYGMSYHGGLIGVIIACIIFSKIWKINPWNLGDIIIPAVPAGYFFGRLGNFLNGELYGRITESSWGMYFRSNGFWELRYPSQLLEAFLEGVLLFFFFWIIRNRKEMKNYFLPLYLFGYGLFRFLAEFFREPDEQIGFILGFLTLGQILCLIMMVVSFGIYLFLKRKKFADIIPPK